jgi:aerobic carbon-monoxide dehydrogenase small subunit
MSGPVEITLSVNGRDYALRVEPRRTLLDVIRTVEGLATGDVLTPAQRAFIAHHGVQCGFWTPGFLMLATGILEREPDISDDDLLEVLSSNLCRCTGYQNIVAAVRAVIAELREGPA